MPEITSQVATIDYISLMAAQLQNQDPLEPTDQANLINDLAQFSTLEGIEGLNASFDSMLQLQELTQGVNLAGKEVHFTNPISGELESGPVSEVLTAGGDVRIAVNGHSLAISEVLSVSAAS